MPELLLLLCGVVHNRTFCFFPIPFRIVNVQDLRETINNYLQVSWFIICHCGRPDSQSAEILGPLSNENNIDVIISPESALNNTPANQVNRLRLSEDLLVYKVALCAIRAYRLILEQNDAVTVNGPKFSQEKQEEITKWLIQFFQVESFIFPRSRLIARMY